MPDEARPIDWKTDAISQAIKQGPSFVFAAAMLGFFGYTINWVLVPAIPMHLQSIQTGYEKNVLRFEAALDKIIAANASQFSQVVAIQQKQAEQQTKTIELLDRQVTRLESRPASTPNE